MSASDAYLEMERTKGLSHNWFGWKGCDSLNGSKQATVRFAKQIGTGEAKI